MASSEKRCLYEVLGLNRDCTPDEIRSAYKKMALQRHPDKLVQSGVPEAEATAAFQELVNAYEEAPVMGNLESPYAQLGGGEDAPDLYEICAEAISSEYNKSIRVP
ncbi:DNAJ JJJ1 homolog [Olea europaea subsp. europaea]|uniref:DNAJ JJJ1 homolog n=1 Tax=Olea europaea subsp. europaea TaxID=158383 RepID=A0A8S0U7A3_OLEEU|nr:DNAJ JJJ1 homolog [Olea europaea subsp. europaea]